MRAEPKQLGTPERPFLLLMLDGEPGSTSWSILDDFATAEEALVVGMSGKGGWGAPWMIVRKVFFKLTPEPT